MLQSVQPASFIPADSELRRGTMKNSLLALVIVLAVSACTSGPAPKTAAVELKHFPLDGVEGVRATTGASFDPKISADGKGSLRVDAKEPITVPLFEVSDVGVENATLIYQASLQSGQKPDLIRLNLVVQGKGRVWIDDIHLMREPLPSR